MRVSGLFLVVILLASTTNSQASWAKHGSNHRQIASSLGMDDFPAASISAPAYTEDGSASYAVWKAFMNSAIEYSRNGDYQQAQKILSKARRETQEFSSANPGAAQTEKLAGDLFVAQHDFDYAERSYKRSVYLYEHLSADYTNELVATLNSYAQLLRRWHRADEANTLEMKSAMLSSGAH